MAYEDLLKDTSESKDDGNYFLVTITDLDIGTAYPLQFRWKNKNGTLGAWSSVKTFVSESATIPSEPNLGSGDVVGGAGFITVTWNGNNALSAAASNFDRVNIHISGTTFGDGTKPAGFFKQAGTQTFTAVAGVYIVQLKTIAVDGTESLFSTARTVTVTEIVEEIQTPVAPTGFTSERILGGIEVAWAGTYGSAWTGFEAINIYAGTSSSATGGTYIKVGQMTANKISNKIVVPVDGTYVRYGVPVYIHASSVNRNGIESAISANVTSQSSGARSAIGTDLADEIISNAKLVNDAVTEAKIATSAITETKIATDAVTSQKIIANAITADKIVSSAITADKIATNAITAGKILAGEIDVTKLSAGTISVNNLESGTLSATSFIRAGTSGSSRIEISSAAVPASSILAGLYIYNGSTAVLQAPLGGGLTITGSLTATQISTSSGNFSVNTSGILSASGASINGSITATGGTIGGLTLAADAIQNAGNTFRLDSSGIIRAGSSSGNAVIISPTLGIYHSANGGSTASGIFTLGLSSSTIAGWTLSSSPSQIFKGSTILDASSTNGFFQIGSGSSFFKVSTSGIQLGNETFGSAPFRVTAAGALTATNADITGAITATSGTFAGSLSSATGSFSSGSIGGLTVNANTLSYGGMTIFTSEAGFGLNYSLYDTGKGIRTQYLTVGDSSNNGTYSYPLSSSSLNVFDKATFYNTVDVSGSGSLTLGSGSVGTNGSVYTSNSSGTATSTTAGAYLASSGYVLGRRASGAPLIAHRTDSNGNIIQFLFSGSAGGFITGSTSVTPSFTGTSDYRAKKNIEDYSGALDLIKQTRPKSFIMKNDPLEKVQVGFIAHEFAEVFPDFVFGQKDALDEDGNPDYQSLSTTNLIPYLMAAVKEMSARLDALEG
jgi:hypothetical protein